MSVLLDATITFEEDIYGVSENTGAVTVCTLMTDVPLEGLAYDLTVTFISIDETAGIVS